MLYTASRDHGLTWSLCGKTPCLPVQQERGELVAMWVCGCWLRSTHHRDTWTVSSVNLWKNLVEKTLSSHEAKGALAELSGGLRIPVCNMRFPPVNILLQIVVMLQNFKSKLIFHSEMFNFYGTFIQMHYPGLRICKFRRTKLLGMMLKGCILSVDYYENERNQSAEEEF